MSTERAELRAERLRVAVTILEYLPDYEARKYPEPGPFLPTADVGLARTCSREDRLLARACLAAERDFRRREWAGVEVLLAAIPPGGSLGDIYDLPAEQALPALYAAQACGWLREGRA
ncbi:MAG: hypothetical protein JWO21_1840 [Solirubrobacterales bacterium]|jgi:hypothetical protein|nr:hypothetical protein [Solirubrobacterales bacterium]